MEVNGNKSLTKLSKQELITYIQIVSDLTQRNKLGQRLGYQYGDDRKIYKALGYPEETDLTFTYYWNKYKRNDIGSAIINRPVDKTWSGDLLVFEYGKTIEDSALYEAWRNLEREHKIKQRLVKLDKLAGIGKYALLVLGLDDVKAKEDFLRPASGKRKLQYIRQIAEDAGKIHEYEDNSSNPRYGQPKSYRIKSLSPGTGQEDEIIIHWSRVIHVTSGHLTSEIEGMPRLEPVINRLVDIEKLLGGDAEMFWRGARPGYHVTDREGYQMTDVERGLMAERIEDYEHDLRRIIQTSGVDINALAQQVADPLHHIDAQLQAISAQTGIPKRILIGSERGELASSQDRDAWLDLIKTRMEEYAEPEILRPLINRLMEFQILPVFENYNVVWSDIFSPSEKEKVDIGKVRAESLKSYADSLAGMEILPIELALKYILGLSDEQIDEALQAMEDQATEEDRFNTETENLLDS